MFRAVLTLFLCGAAAFADSGKTDTVTVKVDSAYVRLMDQVDVPAQSAGVLAQIAVKEGQFVAANEVLVRLNDAELRLAVERAKVDLEIANKKAESLVDTLLARKAVSEAQETKDRAQVELEITRLKAEKDVHVRYSKKALEVANSELSRAMSSRKAFRDSVSQSEIDTLRLATEKTAFEVEQAEHDLAVAKLTHHVKQSEIKSLGLAVERCELELKHAEEDRLIAALTGKAKESDLAAAQLNLDRCTIKSPLAGIVVQFHRHRGEWVQPEDKVLRILRLDRLRAEGYVAFQDLRHNLNGADVTLKVSLPDKSEIEVGGKVVFVSPEIDPVNGQVRVWAEVDNPQFALRPGMKASLTIHPVGARISATSVPQGDR